MNEDLELKQIFEDINKKKIPIEEQRKKWRKTWYLKHKEEHKLKCADYYNENKEDIKLKRDVKNNEMDNDQMEEMKIKKMTYDRARYYLKKHEKWDGFKNFKDLYQEINK